jgi:hypothetical protein
MTQVHLKCVDNIVHLDLQEWLWCETWCGNSTKSAAKTIDLCNNPLTKEPKLQAARRIAPEWSGLDAEAQTFTASVRELIPEILLSFKLAIGVGLQTVLYSGRNVLVA